MRGIFRTTAAALVCAVALSSCTGESEPQASRSGGDAQAGRMSGGAHSGAPDATGVTREGRADGAEPASVPDLGRDVIQIAELTVRTDDVAAAVARTRSLVGAAGGTVSAETTSAGSRRTQRSVLTVRVPAPRYAELLDRLAGLGTLQEQHSSSDDVSLEVIDVEARIASAERALARLRDLLDRAQTLSDVVSLEGELSRREADLEALKGQQAYLEDQTSLSTITLTLLPPRVEQADEDEPTGFLAGLGAGWGALQRLLGLAATTLGVLLPFVVLLGVLLLPTWAVVRRTRLWERLSH